jgi:hypothetical protein
MDLGVCGVGGDILDCKESEEGPSPSVVSFAVLDLPISYLRIDDRLFVRYAK